MRTPKGKKYVSTEPQLHQYARGLKLVPCPSCGKVGFVNGHGFLRGYSEAGQGRVVRGRRFFCSNRHRRGGCGRTFSVLLSQYIKGFMVGAQTLWSYLSVVLGGVDRKPAWESISGSFSTESGYRLWRKLRDAQPPIRTLLYRVRPPPESSSPEPLAQLFAHLRSVFPSEECPLSSFQDRFQTSLL